MAILALVAVVNAGLQPSAVYRVGIGHDYDTYVGAARDWLRGAGFYEAHQLAGPYRIVEREVLYPPPILILLVPFAVLPAPLWWALPLGFVAATAWYWRPSAWAWAGIVGLLAVPITLDFIVTGNPGIWVMAAVAAGTRWGWPAALVLLKPTMAPFALVGIRDPRWWLAIAAIGAFSLLLLPLWVEYVTVVGNVTGPGASPLYSLGRDTPLLLIPLVAWLGRTRSAVG